MDEIKRPFFVVALIALMGVVGLELGSAAFIAPADVGAGVLRETLAEQGFDDDEIDEAVAELSTLDETDDPPGLAIPMLAMIDVQLLLSMVALGLALVVPHRVMARVVAPVNLIASIIIIIIGIILVIVTLVLMFLMIGLFLAVPFGTIVYFARWGFFPRGEAQVVLGILLLLKLTFCGCSAVASPRLLMQKGVVALVLTSIVMQLVVGFLHSLAPFPLVTIVDALAAVIVAIVAIVWAVVILVGSLVGTIRIIKVRT